MSQALYGPDDPSRRMNRLIIGLTIPNILSNITVPLLSLIDVVLAGHMGHAEALGSVTVATTITNTIYWIFGFIRLGTAGLVAQAYGRQDTSDINRQLARGIVMALCCSAVILICSPLASSLSGLVTGGGSARLSDEAQRYIEIIFYGAPAVMVIYALNGWYIGMQNPRVPMIASMSAVVINFLVSYTLVVYYHMGVEGLAIGTTAAQYSQAVILVVTALIRYRHVLSHMCSAHFTDTHGYGRYLLLGKDLILRSVLISSVTLFFTYAGAKEGTVALAANALLMQFFNIFNYFMDGFAYAGESLSGRFIGMDRPDLLRTMIRRLFVIGTFLALLGTLIFMIYPEPLLRLMSNQDEVVRYALDYHVWSALIPLTGFGAFLWDGIYVGATRAKDLKISMIGSCIVFFALYYLLYDRLGMTALWIAFDSYLLTRTIILTALWDKPGRRPVSPVPTVHNSPESVHKSVDK